MANDREDGHIPGRREVSKRSRIETWKRSNVSPVMVVRSALCRLQLWWLPAGNARGFQLLAMQFMERTDGRHLSRFIHH